MNPILETQIKTLSEQLDALHSILEANREEVKKQHAEKEALLQEKWEQRKEVTTLNRIADDFDAVDEENDKYRQERGEMRQHLTDIVQMTKALHGLQKK